jgi:hypothetical protein
VEIFLGIGGDRYYFCGKPDVLKIEGDWQDAMKRSLQNKKPPEGWPK